MLPVAATATRCLLTTFETLAFASSSRAVDLQSIMLQVDQDTPPLVGPSGEKRARKINVAVCMYLFFARAVQYAIASRDFLDTYIMDISSSNEKVGQIESLCGIAALIILLPCGYLADRCKRLRLLQYLAVAKAFPTLMAFIAVRQKNLLLLQVSMVLLAVVNGPFEQVLQVFLVDNTLPEQRTLFLSRKEMLSWLGTAVGPLLALLLVNLHSDTSWSVPLLQNVVCAGLVGYLFVEPAVLLLRNAHPATRDDAAGEVASLPDWTQEVKCGIRKQWLVPVWTEIMWGGTQIASSMSLKYIPLFFRQDFSMSPSWLMIVRVLENLGLAAMNFATPFISAKTGRAWAATLFIFAGAILMLGVASLHQTWLAATLFILRTTFARANVPCVQSIIFESVLPNIAADGPPSPPSSQQRMGQVLGSEAIWQIELETIEQALS